MSAAETAKSWRESLNQIWKATMNIAKNGHLWEKIYGVRVGNESGKIMNFHLANTI